MKFLQLLWLTHQGSKGFFYNKPVVIDGSKNTVFRTIQILKAFTSGGFIKVWSKNAEFLKLP
jgi:hypothetical protein